MEKYIRIASILAVLAVILGAFGAHALKSALPSEQLTSYQIGIRYHFYHVIGLFLLVILQKLYPTVKLFWSARLMTLGIVLFSGSIYLLSCRSILGIENWSWLGPLTPIGGMCFILSWSLVFGAFWKIKK